MYFKKIITVCLFFCVCIIMCKSVISQTDAAGDYITVPYFAELKIRIL